MNYRKRIRRSLRYRRKSCHDQSNDPLRPKDIHDKFEESKKYRKRLKLKKIALVGSPNVGKSVIFNNLTGLYATISNYPGTTVDVMRGKTQIGEEEFEVIDTPGMYSLLPLTDDERVSRLLLFKEKPDLILHIVDAKNLERMLPQTLQLIETGLNLVLVLNVMDEANKLGIKIDIEQLESQLGIPVAVTIATKGMGMIDLKKQIERVVTGRTDKHDFVKQPIAHAMEDAEAIISQSTNNDTKTSSEIQCR